MSDTTALACKGCGGEEITCDGHFCECAKCGNTGPGVYPVPDREIAIQQWNLQQGKRTIEEVERELAEARAKQVSILDAWVDFVNLFDCSEASEEMTDKEDAAMSRLENAINAPRGGEVEGE